MPGKRPQPMIGWLSELLVSGTSGGLSPDVITTKPIPSPKSPIEYKIQSHRGLKNYDLSGGVGLGIVASLEKSSSRNLMSRSDPIPVANSQNLDRFKGGFNGIEMETESLENYSYVTSHKHDKSYTKVYYDAGEYGTISTLCGVVSNSKELPSKFIGGVSTYPTSDFLSSCHLCQKKLHGRDIFIYRGEKAFCSVECRSRQIMVDEHKEKCRSEVPRYVDVSSSPYTTSPIFSTGIIAT